MFMIVLKSIILFNVKNLLKKVKFQVNHFIKRYSATGNRTPVSRVTGGDTHHYTIVEMLEDPFFLDII